MDIRPSAVIDGVHHLTLDQHHDSRGYFMETYRASWLPGLTFVQNNTSKSEAGVLRGLHYHCAQDDLWFIPVGRVEVTLIDLRASSPTYMAIEQFELSARKRFTFPSELAMGSTRRWRATCPTW